MRRRRAHGIGSLHVGPHLLQGAREIFGGNLGVEAPIERRVDPETMLAHAGRGIGHALHAGIAQRISVGAAGGLVELRDTGLGVLVVEHRHRRRRTPIMLRAVVRFIHLGPTERRVAVRIAEGVFHGSGHFVSTFHLNLKNHYHTSILTRKRRRISAATLKSTAVIESARRPSPSRAPPPRPGGPPPEPRPRPRGPWSAPRHPSKRATRRRWPGQRRSAPASGHHRAA